MFHLQILIVAYYYIISDIHEQGLYPVVLYENHLIFFFMKIYEILKNEGNINRKKK